jgi:PDZ domain/Aspartyl protease
MDPSPMIRPDAIAEPGLPRRAIGGILVLAALATCALAVVGSGLGRARAGLGAGQEAPAGGQARDRARAKTSVVPFVMLPTNHMLVEAKINGKGPYRLIFDLGAPITLLSNRASEASGVVQADAPRAFLFGMRGEAEIDKLEAGGLAAEKLPVVVFDHPVLAALGDVIGRRIDGIMGFTLFARYRTTIDYQTRKMTFEPVDYQVRDLLKELPDRMLGPKVARQRVLSPTGVWGLRLGRPTGGLDDPGVPVVAVAEGSPADRGGLKPGDVITTLDGRWTATIADVFAAAADAEPGRAAEVVILRDGKEMTLSVTPAEGA